MNPSQIKRPVATVDRNAWFLRFYLWLYAADVEKVDFCRLFWGYVFCVPMLLLRILLIPIFLLWDGLVWMKRRGIHRIADGAEWIMDHSIVPLFRWMWGLIPEGPINTEMSRGSRLAYAVERGKPKKEREPSRAWAFFKSLRSSGGEMFLGGVGKAADKGIEFGQLAWPVAKWIFVAIGVLFGGVLAALCGYALYMLITVLPVILEALGTGFAAAGEGIAWLVTTIVNSQWIWVVPLVLIGAISLILLVVAGVRTRPVQKAGTVVGKSTIGFGTAMKVGAKSVKYRTCPVIKVEDTSKRAGSA